MLKWRNSLHQRDYQASCIVGESTSRWDLTSVIWWTKAQLQYRDSNANEALWRKLELSVTKCHFRIFFQNLRLNKGAVNEMEKGARFSMLAPPGGQ
ncbi:hypothetical protein MTO96_001534 [Rhipicephalus appendiculatus]